MIIQYAQNPLETKVFLNDTEKKLLFYRVKLDKLCNNLFDIQYNVDQATTRTTQHENEWIEENYSRIRKSPNKYLIDNIDNLWKKFDKIEYNEEEIKDLIEDLQNPHCGDCEYHYNSCGRCLAESYLGIDTVKDFGGNPPVNSLINFVFGRIVHKNIDVAISYLSGIESYYPYTGEGWIQFRSYVVDILKVYKKDKLNK
jgi:hypothetical protein